MPVGLSSLSDADAARALGEAVKVVLDRHGVESTIELRSADDAPVPMSHTQTPERTGDLLRPSVNGGVPASVVATVSDALPTTLRFTSDRSPTGIRVAATSDRDNTSWAKAIAAHAEILLRAASERPDARCDEIELLTADERRRVLGGLGGELASYAATTLHEMFQQQARRTPDAVGANDGATQITYRELDQASNRVARQLRQYVTIAGHPVVACGRRSVETLAVKLGVMKAGGAFVYLDPALPATHAARICQLAEPVVAIASRDVSVPRTTAPLLVLEELLDAAGVPDAPVSEIANEATAAYILFTSGSTGEPKGVIRPHRMNTTRVFLEQRMYGFGPSDRHLLKALQFHREVFLGLTSGGSVVFARPGGERDDAYLVELMERERITVASFVPSMLRVLLDNRRFRVPELPLRHLFVAGEVLDPALEERLRERGFAVHVTYTLAEADYVAHRGGATAGNSVGRPLDMRVYLCDPQARLRPPGFVGEILTGGPGLADGYVNRPELTAERFIANPFEPAIVPRLFRTGDLGRFREDGELEFIGRIDDQIKVRGQRVEPTEVEYAIRRHDGVDNAVVTSLPDHDEGHVLVAYVLFTADYPSVAALRALLTENLPSYMVPAFIVPVSSLPLLGSGKVDRASLKIDRHARPAGLDPPVEPADNTERRVLVAWRRVLGVEAIGVEDSFLDLGGDSLKVMLLRAAIEEQLGEAVPLAALVSSPTVRDFCENRHRVA